jgi:hypothetical protein
MALASPVLAAKSHLPAAHTANAQRDTQGATTDLAPYAGRGFTRDRRETLLFVRPALMELLRRTSPTYGRVRQCRSQRLLSQRLLPRRQLPQRLLPRRPLPQRPLPQRLLPRRPLPQRLLPRRPLPQRLLPRRQPQRRRSLRHQLRSPFIPFHASRAQQAFSCPKKP